MIKIDRLGFRRDGHTNDGDLMVALAQQHARIASAAVADLTDSSGGTADATAPYSLLNVTQDAANVAASGLSLADKTTTEANLNLVKDALLEMATTGNLAAVAVGAASVTYNGGGTAANATIEAIGVAVTGAATGVVAASYNATTLALKDAMFTVGALINRLAVATGRPQLVLSALQDSVTIEYDSTVAAITVAGGTAADPGVTKVRVDADLVKFRTNIATMAARLAAVIGVAGAPEVLVVQ